MKHIVCLLTLLIGLLGVTLISFAQAPEATDQLIAPSMTPDIGIPSSTPMPTITPIPTLLPTATSTPIWTIAAPPATDGTGVLTLTPEATATHTLVNTIAPTIIAVTATSTVVVDVVAIIPDETTMPPPDSIVTVSGTTIVSPTIDSDSVSGTAIAITPTLQLTTDMNPTLTETATRDLSIEGFTDYPYIDQINNPDNWLADGNWHTNTEADGNSYWQLTETEVESSLQNTMRFESILDADILLTFSTRMDGYVSGGRVEASHDETTWFVLKEVETSVEWTTESIMLFTDFSEPIYIRFVWMMPATTDPISTFWHIDQMQVVRLERPTPTPEVNPSETAVTTPILTATPHPIDYCQFDKVQDSILTIEDLVVLRIQPAYGQSVDTDLTMFDYDLNRDKIFDVLDLQMLTQYMGMDCHLISVNLTDDQGE